MCGGAGSRLAARPRCGRRTPLSRQEPAKGERMEAGYGFQAISTSNKNPEQPSECLLRS